MCNLVFYDAKPYDRRWFDALAPNYGVSIRYLETRLNPDAAALAAGGDAVCAFVNDDLGAETLDKLVSLGVRVVALRCSGFNQVDLNAARGRIAVLRVPSYSPNAIAEHSMALLLTLNRKTHRAYNRTRDYNFSLKGLDGFDLNGKTVGVIGTGRVGQAFCRIAQGFGMEVLGMDPYPVEALGIQYTDLEDLCRRSHVISLHCPLTRDTFHMIDAQTLAYMRRGVYLINTSRGALIDSQALLAALKSGQVGAAGLDVYEEESEFFYEDVSDTLIRDDTLKLLLSTPNVLVTSHQAFLTQEALHNIAAVTLENLRTYWDTGHCDNALEQVPTGSAQR